MIDWVQTSVTEQNDSKYHVMNIGKLNNMGYNVDATIYMRELVPNSFITRIKLGYAYISKRIIDQDQHPEITLRIGVSEAQGSIRAGSSNLEQVFSIVERKMATENEWLSSIHQGGLQADVG